MRRLRVRCREQPVQAGGGDDGTRHFFEEEPDDAHRKGEQREERHGLHDIAR